MAVDTDRPVVAEEPPGAAGGSPRRRPTGWLVNSGTVAVLTWVIATPVAAFLPAALTRDPFSQIAFALPLTAALCLAAGFLLVTRRWPGEVVAGVAAGAAAAWVVLILRTSLYGTPYGFGGLIGDMMRMSASATHYTTTIAPSDPIPGLVSEYPPLYAMVVGRLAVLFDVEAWRLLADAEVVTTSAAVLVAFLLWRRHVGSWLALAISGLAIVTWADPRKAFEVITLSIFVPWALETFGRPPRARMHWLVSGLLAAFMVVVYQAWIIYSVFGLLALIVVTYRAETDRRAYLRRLALVAAVAFAASSWYAVPYVWAMLTEQGELVSDLYVSAGLNTGLFPFLEFTPIGALQLTGLVGLVWFYRSVWWARPLLFIVVGVYAYRLIAQVRFVLTEHTTFLHYTARLYTVVLSIAGILVLAHAVPMVLRRLGLVPPRAAGAAVLAVALAWGGAQFTRDWMPRSGAAPFTGPYYAAAAHTEPLPGGGYPAYAPPESRRAWFPVTPIRAAVEAARGRDARLVTLTADERLFAFLPWPAYVAIPVEGAGSLSRWRERRAEVTRLSRTADPEAFAAASAGTAFGPIDVFVLRKRSDGWQWDDVRFRPEQFSPAHWSVVDVPENYVVAVRRTQ